MRDYAVIIPHGIDLNQLVELSSDELNVDYLRYLIDYVVRGQVSNPYHLKTRHDDENNSLFFRPRYVGLPKAARLLPNLHKEHINFLCSNNIEVRRSRSLFRSISIFYRKEYILGKNPLSFRLSGNFCENKLKIELIKQSNIKNKLFSQIPMIPPELKSGKYKFLRKWFDPNNLKIDIEKAMAVCDQRYADHKCYKKYTAEVTRIVNFYNGKYYLYFNKETDGRVHSNITFLPKAYRKFMTYDDKSLVEVDLSSSVLFFLSNLINNTKVLDVLKNISNSLLMIHKSLQGVDNEEFDLIKKLVQTGKLYEFFIDDFSEVYSDEQFTGFLKGGHFDLSFTDRRKVIKKRIIAMIFAKPEHYLVEQEIFTVHFPVLVKRLNEFKNKFGHEKLAHALSQFEAFCVLDIAAKNFHNNYYRKAPIFTLHDCLITTSDHKNELESMMTESLQRFLGSAPAVESKEWS